MARPPNGAAVDKPRWSIFKVLQVLYENIALEGRNGIQVRKLFEIYEPSGDIFIQEACWNLLCQGQTVNNPVWLAHDPSVAVKTEPDTIKTEVNPKKRKAAPVKQAAKKKAKKKSNSDSDEEEYSIEAHVKSTPPRAEVNKKKSPGSIDQFHEHELHPVDGRLMTLQQAMGDTTLVIVATYELRLQALGYSRVGVDLNVNLLGVLEMVGQKREKGITVSSVSDALFGGDIKRMHYFLDDLVAMQLVEKRILTLPPRRFNIVHLTRFALQFDPQSMGYEGFYYENDSITKSVLATRLLQSMKMRKEDSAVFPDVAKRFDLNKRQQESLRNYICQENERNPGYPLQMFMATCRGGERSTGRKLWCVRVVDPSSIAATSTTGPSFSFPLQVELGAAEYLYRLVESSSTGTTIPEIKDVCGNPDNKWVYKKMQHMLVHHTLLSEKVMGSRGVIHKFKVQPSSDSKATPLAVSQVGRYSSLRNSIQNSGQTFVANISDERRDFLMSQINAQSIISVGLLRRLLSVHENKRGTHAIDGRTIIRLLQPLVEAKKIEFVDVKVPMKKVARHSRVRCAALPFVMKEESQEMLRNFLNRYSPLDDLDTTNKWTDSSFSIVREDHVHREKAIMGKKTPKKIISYTHNPVAFNKVRQKLRDHHRQCRRLGQAYGIICRVRLLHVAICKALTRMGRWAPDNYDRVEFSFQEVVSNMPVKDFCQVFGTPEPLSDKDELLIKQTIQSSSTTPIPDQWKMLGDIGKLLQRNVRNRGQRLVDILMDFKLLQQEESQSLHHECVYASDVDLMVSRVVDQTVQGGVFYLTRHVFIAIVDERASTPLRMPGVLKPTGFSPLEILPLEYNFSSAEDVEQYWRHLEVFYLERVRWEYVADSPLPDQVPMFVKPYLVPAVNATLALLWTDSGTLQHRKVGIIKTRAKPKKQRFSTNLINPAPKWKREAGVPTISRRSQPLRIKAPRRRAEKFELTHDQEQAALQAYMDKLVAHWQVEIPLELRFSDEERVFRNSRVKRGRINWNTIGLDVHWPVMSLGKSRPYVGLEVKRRLHRNVLCLPDVKKRVREMEAALIVEKNPTGEFIEEELIKAHPHLYGCLVKATQMMLHPDEEYETSVGDDILSGFSTIDMQTVWRFLYLSGMVNKSKPADTGHRRGFSFSLSMFDFFRLNASQWPLTMCAEAAEHMGLLSTLDEEMKMAMPTNASPGYMATLLASCVRGSSVFDIAFEKTPDEVYDAMASNPHDRRYKDAGVIGHMHRFTQGKSYEEFNQDWIISTKTAETKSEDDGDLEAFSMSKKRKRQSVREIWRCLCQPKQCSSLMRCKLKFISKLTGAVDGAKEIGMSVPDMLDIFPFVSRNLMQDIVDDLVAEEKLMEVHAFSHVRYVMKANASLWCVHPYKREKRASVSLVEFNRDEPVVARPWLKMDGTLNEKFMVVLKREITMLVAEHPGIGEESMRTYFKGLFGLQDLRSLCFQLVDDGVLYSRATKRRKVSSSLFAPSTPPPEPEEADYDMDRDEYNLSYFASIDCFGHLGNAVQELL
ncbi:unnamed protein product [Aphanomyces euteiches]|uniref:Uncharacterized protein n=2 Tax=Aphanomyces euteiches TaxID=100861 RepID=A0A6G0XT41_9STRA|nr:hypothetical protein Ae201684_001426 [Aphanomyces euteiches]KAH9075226.1 hypothetical protein Ae201684P_003909 [Aphanomyces euteiches]KAH9141295.1 hypothetical protein AeRB84_014496 [Aphanomyces euteiches]KAH9142329.1 hypothetical protein AeRB84_013598 [Aphanomyces euteiches]KAH9146506.1 hypothetical protein AeRB84_009611 [Aphanomyces euteiches]